jgi:hypothetical protein
MPEWINVIAPILGGFAAAWFGARLAFRKTVRERALAGRIAWYEEAIRSLFAYEEILQRLDKDYFNIALVQPMLARRSDPKAASDSQLPEPPRRFTPSPELWKELVDTEARLRRSLQLHDVYTEGSTRTACSVTLDRTATIAVGQWFVIGDATSISRDDLVRRYSIATTRRALEMELRRILQYDGVIRSTFPWINKKFVMRDLRRQRKALDKLRIPKAKESSAKD